MELAAYNTSTAATAWSLSLLSRGTQYEARVWTTMSTSTLASTSVQYASVTFTTADCGSPACQGDGTCALVGASSVCSCGNICGLNCPVHNGTVCGGKGSCTTAVAPSAAWWFPEGSTLGSDEVARVEVGTGESFCDCDGGFVGRPCSVDCGRAGDTLCSGHGMCTRDGCVCDGSFAGADCSAPCAGGCSDTAVCTTSSPSSAEQVCACPSDTTPVRLSNGETSVPLECHSTAECVEQAGGDVCSGHGTCSATVVQDTGRVEASCQCDAGYAGTYCGVGCQERFGLVCSGRGTCSAQGGDGGSGVCVCDFGYGGQVRWVALVELLGTSFNRCFVQACADPVASDFRGASDSYLKLNM